MDGKIRVSSGVKKIEVNDQGEYILLPLSDDSFVSRFYKLLDEIKRTGEGLAKSTDTPDITTVDSIVELEKSVRAKTDELFGAETCRKVFGDVLPSMDLFVEFFGLLVPYFEDYKQERLAKMNKYDAHRTGSAL